MTCKGICVRHKAQKPVGSGRYASGQKRCQICEIFIKWDGLWCPCCGYRLRTRPRNLSYKAKLRARKSYKPRLFPFVCNSPISKMSGKDGLVREKSKLKVRELSL